MDGTMRQEGSDGGPDQASAKARLFGDDASDHLRKQVIKARFLAALGEPTAGGETSDQREGVTEPSDVDELAVEPVRVGRFAVLSKLGQGGMGIVYAAYDEQLDRKVALKLLRGELAKDDRGRARMAREAQALARLSHPNVVQVHEVGQWRGHEYVAMEFIEGLTLQRWLDERERSHKEILDVMIQAGRGLAAAHAAGLVHRDFKPANLLVAKDGRARVLDFGLARAAGEVEPFAVADMLETDDQGKRDAAPAGTVGFGETSAGDSVSSRTSGSSSAFDQLLTATGAVLGTPAYMAPEQHLGERATEASDQFSFCVVFYEALFGQRPHQAKSRTEYAIRVTEGDFDPPSPSSGVPAWLRRAVCRGLAAMPQDRWPSMDALLAELSRDRGQLWKRSVVAAGLLASLGVALVVGGGGDRGQVCEYDRSLVADSWGDDQRDRLRASFAAVSPDALAVYEQTAASLDAYADTLVAARTDACEQRWVDKLQTDAQFQLRTRCLEQRQGELRAVVDVLAEADAQTVLHASDILGGLGDVGVCAQLDLLETSLPVAKDAEAIAAIAETREAIARGHAMREAGHVDRAVEIATAARERAVALDYSPLVGEVALLDGANAYRARTWDVAEAALLEAAGIAERTRHPELGVDTMLLLARTRLQSGDESQTELALAEAQVARLGDRPADQFELHVTRGLALRAARHYEVALAEFDEAVRVGEAGFLGSEHELAGALACRASLLSELSRVEQAHADLDRALELGAGLGARDPMILDALFDLAVTELDGANYDRAEALFDEALTAYERVYGPRYPMIGHGRLALARIAVAREDYDEAARRIDAALEILDATHEDHSWALDAKADLLLEHGDDPERAVELLTRASEHVARHGSSDENYHGYLQGRLGKALARAGRPEQAFAAFDRAIAALDTDPPTHELARPLLERGLLHLELGQHQQALASLERAHELLPVDCGQRVLAAEVRVAYADTLRALGRDAQLRRHLAHEAVTLLEGLPGNEQLHERARESSPD